MDILQRNLSAFTLFLPQKRQNIFKNPYHQLPPTHHGKLSEEYRAVVAVCCRCAGNYTVKHAGQPRENRGERRGESSLTSGKLKHEIHGLIV